MSGRVLVTEEERTSTAIPEDARRLFDEADELTGAGWVRALSGRGWIDPDGGDVVCQSEAIRLLRRHGVRGDAAWQREESERIGALVLDREVGE